MADTIKFEGRGLQQLIKALKNIPKARVGVQGDKTRKDDNDNAKIGIIHEFGTDKMPQRSFLRVPITEHLQEEIDKTNAFDEDVLKDVIKTGNIRKWMAIIGHAGEACVQTAFMSNGYNKWQPWSKGYQSMTGQILMNTQDLRRSIASEVED